MDKMRKKRCREKKSRLDEGMSNREEKKTTPENVQEKSRKETRSSPLHHLEGFSPAIRGVLHMVTLTPVVYETLPMAGPQIRHLLIILTM